MRARLVGDGDGRPMIVTFSTCVDSIRTIPFLQHDPDRPEDVMTDSDDHAGDEWRYACMSRPWVPVREAPKPLNVIAAIADRGAGFKSLKDTWADTTTAHGRLMLTVLGGLAEFERELIRARTGEGRKRAKDRGVKFGRPRKMTPHQRQEAIQRLAAGETQADVARTYNVDAATICRLAAASPFAHVAVAALQ
jgi:Resolvase, N terminal domain/Helix-turn-helix domain of resolvase